MVILTPKSIGKPWLMWEAGAVSGVSLATRESSAIVPVLYRLSNEELPSPLRSRLAVNGENGGDIRRVLETLMTATPLSKEDLDHQATSAVPQYLERVAHALAETPPQMTEAAVNEWLDRLDYFARTDRRSAEIGQLHRALVYVFAPGDNAFNTPLDVRLHRRLGDIYLFGEAGATGDRPVRPGPPALSARHLPTAQEGTGLPGKQ